MTMTGLTCSCYRYSHWVGVLSAQNVGSWRECGSRGQAYIIKRIGTHHEEAGTACIISSYHVIGCHRQHAQTCISVHHNTNHSRKTSPHSEFTGKSPLSLLLFLTLQSLFQVAFSSILELFTMVCMESVHTFVRRKRNKSKYCSPLWNKIRLEV